MDSYLAHPDLIRGHIDTLQSIVNNQLGKGYLTDKQIRECVEPGGSLFMGVAFPDKNADEDPPVAVFYTSLPEGPSGRTRGLTEFPDGILEKPVGICIGGVFSQSRLASYLNIDTTDYPRDLLDAKHIGVIRTTAIREELQNRGIGSELVTKTMDLHEQQGVDKHLAVAWRSPTGTNIHSILVENGLKPEEVYTDYWLKESRERGFTCPECGSPCTCSGIVYID